MLTAPRRAALPLELAFVTLTLLSGPSHSLPAPLVLAAQSLSPSSLDFSPLGSVAIAGDFAGLQFWDEQYAASQRIVGNGTAASLWTRNSNGTLQALGATNQDGSISAICQSQKANKVYLGGNFTSIGGVAASNVASYDPSSNSFADLAGGLDGAVHALGCDDGSGTLYVGGAFNKPVAGGNGYAGHVASWNPAASQWSALPFGGLNDDVDAIEPISSSLGQSVLFGGSFGLSLANSSSLAGASVIPSLASGLTPISLAGAQVSQTSASSNAGFGDPSSVLCPPGADGTAGSTFLGADGRAATITINLNRALRVRGLRLGNTFFQGRGTKQFQITILPSNTAASVSYYADAGNTTSALATCTSNCPLSNNSALPYQDFLFTEELIISGFTIELSEFYGAGPGLHLIQLLSYGAYAYAVDSLNGVTCSSGLGQVLGNSSATNSGLTPASNPGWTQITVPSVLQGIDEQVLKSYIPVGTSSAASPSITFSPYIGWEGNYSVAFTLSSCTRLGDCAMRTSADIEVSPGGGLPMVTETVNQLTYDDASPIFYTGQLNQGATFTVRLSANPTGSGTNGEYHFIVDSIQLVASQTNGTIKGAARPGYGVFEYVPSGTGAFGSAAVSGSVNAASGSVAATPFDALALGITQGGTVGAIASSSDGSATFVGGGFLYSANGTSLRSLVAFPTSLKVPGGGLAGTVLALAVLDGWLYAGGQFNATADGSVANLPGIARWQYGQAGSTWQPLTGGMSPNLTGGVRALEIMSNMITIVGGDSLATYNPSVSSFTTSGSTFFSGQVDALAGPYVAGSIQAGLQYSASSAAQLVSDNGTSTIQPYGFSLNANPAVASSSAPAVAKRHTQRKRAAAPSATALPAALSGSSVDGVVLAGTWWQNGSNEVAILGGQFSSGSASNIGVVNNGSLVTLPGLPLLNGPVRALTTDSNTLFIGGSFSQGLLIYDLAAQAPITAQPTIQAYDASTASINAIAPRPNNATAVIVAGYFAAVGSLPCPSICQYNTDSQTWSALGAGLNGVVGSIDFAGNSLIAAGDFQLNGATAYAAMWDWSAQTWTALSGGVALPGPATAVSADDANSQNVFLAGTTSNDGSAAPYVVRWNGSGWSDVASGSLSSGIVQHLAFVPLNSDDNHADASGIESDRVLMASGNMVLGSFGSIASALFDGTSWTPFLVTATSTGSAGAIASFFFSASSFRMAKHYMAIGFVILISMGIALGIVFLLVLFGLLFALRTRRINNELPAYPVPYANEKDQDATTPHRRPTSLLATLNAATAMMALEKPGKATRESTPEDDTDSIDEADLTAEKAAEEDEMTFSRFSFVGENAGELSVAADQELKLLDRSDDNWWLVQDSSGNRGLVPRSYLLG